MNGTPNDRDALNAAVDHRDVRAARDAAFDALLAYGLLAKEWNAPDLDHTNYEIDELVRNVKKAVFLGAI